MGGGASADGYWVPQGDYPMEVSGGTATFYGGFEETTVTVYAICADMPHDE